MSYGMNAQALAKSQLRPGYGKLTTTNESINRYSALEQMHLTDLVESATSRFKWNDLPDTVSERYIESTLLMNALIVFFKDTDRGELGTLDHVPGTDKFMALRATYSSQLGPTDDPTEFNIHGNMFVAQTRTDQECVPIWPNYLRTPDFNICQIYASKLADLDQTIEINAHNARQNKVVIAPENQRHSAAQINRLIDQGETIKASDPLVNGMFYTLDLGVNMGAVSELSVLRSRIKNECMEMLGIDNSNQDKKERLVSSETEGNNDQIMIRRRNNLKARELACDQINKMFELNISVEYHGDDLSHQGELEDEETDYDDNETEDK